MKYDTKVLKFAETHKKKRKKHMFCSRKLCFRYRSAYSQNKIIEKRSGKHISLSIKNFSLSVHLTKVLPCKISTTKKISEYQEIAAVCRRHYPCTCTEHSFA